MYHETFILKKTKIYRKLENETSIESLHHCFIVHIMSIVCFISFSFSTIIITNFLSFFLSFFFFCTMEWMHHYLSNHKTNATVYYYYYYDCVCRCRMVCVFVFVFETFLFSLSNEPFHNLIHICHV